MIERRILDDMPKSEVTNNNYANLTTYSFFGSLTNAQASSFGFTQATGTRSAANNMNDEDQTNESGPLLFSIDFLTTKKMKLNKFFTKFMNEDKTIANAVK